MAKPTLNVCLIGQKFMGRTHSNAYMKVNKFFDLPVFPVMKTLVGRNAAELNEFAERWGWKQTSTDWKKAISDPEIQLVDIGTPNNMHAEMSIAALEAGKNVACEKPLAGTINEARQMRDAARKAKNCRRSSGTTTAGCRRSRWPTSSPAPENSASCSTFAACTSRTGPGPMCR